MKSGEKKELVTKETAMDVASRLKQFCRHSQLTQLALNAVAHTINDGEITRLRDVFLAVDSDGDGMLTVEELRHGLQRLRSNSLDIEQICAVIAERGGSFNSCINYREWIAATMRKRQYTDERNCWEAFRMIDKDGDG